MQLQGQYTELALRGLTEGAIVQYLAERFPVSQLPIALPRVLHQSTEGNPLFLVMVVADWLRRGVLAEVAGQWTLQAELESVAREVPESLRQIVERQLEQLHPEEQRVLEVASVARTEFSAAAVAAGIEAEVGAVEEMCERLVRRSPFLSRAGTAAWPDGTVAASYGALGNTLHRLGELPAARAHLEQGIRHYDAMRHHVRSSVYGLDDGVAGLGYAAVVLWSLGYPDQALQRTHEMLTPAQETAHPLNLAWASNTAAWQYQLRREGPQTQEHAEAGMRLCTEYGFAQLLAVGRSLRGWALAAQGQREDGMAQMREGLTAFQETGAQIGRPRYLAMLATVYGDMGQTTEGLTLLDEALTVTQHTGERFSEAEFYRLKGELLLAECRMRNSISDLLPVREGC